MWSLAHSQTGPTQLEYDRSVLVCKLACLDSNTQDIMFNLFALLFVKRMATNVFKRIKIRSIGYGSISFIFQA